MKALPIFAFFTLVAICSGNTLRISEMADAEGKGVERMVYKRDNHEEVCFVKTEVVIGDADVKEAGIHPAGEGRIYVELNEEGAKKLKATTARMKHGQDRLAIIVEGRLHSAPVVQDTLGASFVISGLQDLDQAELDDLARKISGRPPRPEGEALPMPTPKPETVPYTEEEYQANKANREKMGIHYLESIPPEAELDKLMSKGMTKEEVLAQFGNPTMAMNHIKAGDFDWIYEIAPEKRPENPNREMIPQGFKVNFEDDKLSRWSLIHSNASREEKILGAEEPTLKVIMPKLDFSTGDLDLVAFVEGIGVPDPRQSVNHRDLCDLISIAMIFSNMPDAKPGQTTLNADCDFLQTVSHHFAEVAALRKSAEQGRVKVDKLIEILSPYAYGEKELPAINKPKAEAE